MRRLRVHIADDNDPVMRVVRLSLAGLDNESKEWLQTYFSSDWKDPVVEVTSLLDEAKLRGQLEVSWGAAGDETELTGIIKDINIIIFRRAELPKEVVRQGKCLRLIQQLGERLQGVDLKEASRQGIPVCILPRPSLKRTAEHVIMLMLMLVKQALRADKAVRQQIYQPAVVCPIDQVHYNWCGLTGLDALVGKTLGIIGLGEVGAYVAIRARAFEMRVAYTQRRRLSEDEEKEYGVTFKTLEDLLSMSDYISLHIPYNEENHMFMDETKFSLIKEGARFINTARGKLVDESALLHALHTGRLTGAGLDVHYIEPRAMNDPLYNIDNVVLTPHIAGGSRYELFDEVRTILRNIRAVTEDRIEALEHRVV